MRGSIVEAVEIFCADAEATTALGARLGKLLRGGDCVALAGSLGAGKTTLAQGIAAGAGSRDRVTSPTFTLVNEYAAPGITLYHVDLYRLAEAAATMDASQVALQAATLGLDEVIGAADAILLVEWADLLPAFLPADHLQVTLATPETGGRTVRLSAAPNANRAREILAGINSP